MALILRKSSKAKLSPATIGYFASTMIVGGMYGASHGASHGKAIVARNYEKAFIYDLYDIKHKPSYCNVGISTVAGAVVGALLYPFLFPFTPLLLFRSGCPFK